jgi:hypothetical protein
VKYFVFGSYCRSIPKLQAKAFNVGKFYDEKIIAKEPFRESFKKYG